MIGEKGKKRGERSKEKAHTLKKTTVTIFYCFKKRWMVLMRKVSHEILRITISIPMFVHLNTRQVLGTEININIYWERKRATGSTLYISNCTDQEKKKKKKKPALLYSIYFDGGGGGGGVG